MAKPKPKPKDTKPIITPTGRESYNVIGISVLLVLLQLVLNIFHIGGMGAAIVLYFVAASASSTLMFYWDKHGVLIEETDEDEKLYPWDYLKRAAVDAGLMVVGLVLWPMLGVWKGADKLESGESVWTNFHFARLFYSFASHLTFFSITRFWMNIYYSIFGESKEDNQKRKKR